MWEENLAEEGGVGRSDGFDLTLECIRWYCAGVSNPLHEVLCPDSEFLICLEFFLL